MNELGIRTILAPTDLSEASIPALAYARLFADRFKAALTVMYSDPVLYPIDFMPPVGFFVPAGPEEDARLRAEVKAHAERVMEGRPYSIEVAVGQPVPAILATARERHPDLIVMGTHLRHGWRRAMLGSVSNDVIHESPCPVLTVAAERHSIFEGRRAVTKILCPVNFTEVARDGLRVAVQLAQRFNAHLEVVHVLETDNIGDMTADEEKARQWIAPELQNVCSYRQLVLRGGAAERVLDCVEDIGADLLVAGAQHRVFRDPTVIGATTERIIRFATCPVLVVPRSGTRATAQVGRETTVPAH
jgi:nucleotide-binding universal stress UspA family protein